MPEICCRSLEPDQKLSRTGHYTQSRPQRTALRRWRAHETSEAGIGHTYETENGKIMFYIIKHIIFLNSSRFFFQFVAHPNVQQLLSSLWYEGLPGFRRKSLTKKLMEIVKVATMFPFFCLLYMVAPGTKTGKLMRKPFMKFLIHASSYLFFLCK